ncbi:unannotated protein [freshwater metagenome]|jgi:hypothetical protein|uniref:Unannotated protein n=1 Tax=freshwater metagenome TaxID=449393 RepID=A0A6J6JAJ4_9ZZZZ
MVSYVVATKVTIDFDPRFPSFQVDSCLHFDFRLKVG